MIQAHLKKISFSLALAAILALGIMALGSQPAEAVPYCSTRDCSGFYYYGQFCVYFEQSTGCYFRCRIGYDALGECRGPCDSEPL